ncbi:MAG: hypothetical protein WAM14_18405 [Candidatus Nitrosopolaris sp.]
MLNKQNRVSVFKIINLIIIGTQIRNNNLGAIDMPHYTNFRTACMYDSIHGLNYILDHFVNAATNRSVLWTISFSA